MLSLKAVLASPRLKRGCVTDREHSGVGYIGPFFFLVHLIACQFEACAKDD